MEMVDASIAGGLGHGGINFRTSDVLERREL